MLTDEEWETVRPHLELGIDAYRAGFPKALAVYERITGFKETDPNAIWHHRAGQFGPPCHICHKPLRTPKAKLCVACGTKRLPA